MKGMVLEIMKLIIKTMTRVVCFVIVSESGNLKY